jgi:stress response protein YsnF
MRPFEPGKIDVMERTELPVISKRRMVIEELVISRHVVERKERIRTSIRRLNVDVERLRKPPSS